MSQPNGQRFDTEPLPRPRRSSWSVQISASTVKFIITMVLTVVGGVWFASEVLNSKADKTDLKEVHRDLEHETKKNREDLHKIRLELGSVKTEQRMLIRAIRPELAERIEEMDKNE